MPRHELDSDGGVCFSQRSPVFSAVLGTRPGMISDELEEKAWNNEKSIGPPVEVCSHSPRFKLF